ncbi:MAG: hypothetical protein QGG40_10210, partial [Myxococcota bacterium]|nr:hypothetical protein [Myxococcota bacterium]
MFALLFASCLLSILPLYQQEREQVMIPATGVPEAWEPEIRFRMSSAQLSELARLSIEETLAGPTTNLEFEGPLGLEAGLRPTATVEELNLKASKDCEGCLDLTVQVKGKAKWHIGPVSGTVPFDAFG